MTDQAIVAPRRTSPSERYPPGREAALAALRADADGAVRRARAGPERGFASWRSGPGAPVLFVHGTVGPGSWPSLVAAHAGHPVPRPRSARMGSAATPVDFREAAYRPFVADLLAALLDSLDIDRVDVVGGSIGDVWALSLAEHHPTRVGRVVLLGGGPIVADVRVPGFIRVLASPIGAVIVRLPIDGIGCCPSCATTGTRPASRTGACPTSSSTGGSPQQRHGGDAARA